MHAMDTLQVIELRQYTLHPGRRDELIALFERQFVESQEALGMTLLGLFRDLDDADRFVWLRGFADMASRRQALERFYGGPVWRAHRDAANATMIDSDDVLLLRPALDGDVPFVDDGRGGVVHATVCALPAPADAPFVRRCVAAHAAPPLTCLQTEPAPNDFPRLPVRSGEHFVAIAREPAPARWTDTLPRPPRRLRLAPTARSRLR
jgi:quinol monooxygenase YgiN